MNRSSDVVQQLDRRLLEALRVARKSGSKNKFIKVFQSEDKRFSLNRILLPMAEVEPDQAKRDMQREKVIFNGVNFFGYQERFVPFLESYVRRLVKKLRWPPQRAQEITEAILEKASRTASGYDSYFFVNELFEVPGHLLKPRFEPTPPVRVDLVAAPRGALLCHIASKNLYGLYDFTHIDDTSRADDEHPSPWLRLDAEVFENIDFAGDNRWARFMRVSSPDAMAGHGGITGEDEDSVPSGSGAEVLEGGRGEKDKGSGDDGRWSEDRPLLPQGFFFFGGCFPGFEDPRNIKRMKKKKRLLKCTYVLYVLCVIFVVRGSGIQQHQLMIG
uniref:Uncharacterized protein n=1 Tax=Heterosigma akashiwo TaxID=2829 RepID=A0A7S3UYC6_HETAK